MRKNKKNLARILALTLSLIMVLGLSVTAFATEGAKKAPTGPDYDDYDTITGKTDDGYPSGMNGTGVSKNVRQGVKATLITETGKTGKPAEDKGTIAIKGLPDGVTIDAYQFIGTETDGDGKFVKYVNKYDKVAFVDADGNVDLSKFTRENMSAVAEWAQDASGITHIGNSEFIKANDRMEAKAAPGSYVIVVKNGDTAENETRTFGAMVVSVCYASYETLNGAELGLEANMAFAKMQDAPSIEKAIVYGETGYYNCDPIIHVDAKGKGDTAVAAITDTIYFDIMVDNIPEYHGTHPKLVVTDYMDAGLQYVADSAEYAIYFGEGDAYADTDGTIKDDYKVSLGIKPTVSETAGEDGRKTLTFDFAPDNSYKLNDYAGKTLVIRYKADVIGRDNWDENNVQAMPNKAKLEYTHNSNVASDPGEDETTDRIVYTLRLSMTKVDGKNETTKLGGAEFMLYEEETCEHPLTEAKVVSGDDGVFTFEGVNVGTWYMKELKAPSGYTESNKVYKVVVKAKAGGADFAADSGDRVVTAAVYTVDDGTAELDNYNVANSRMTDLPTTGGAGTAFLVGLGIVGVLLGCVVIFSTRKKQED